MSLVTTETTTLPSNLKVYAAPARRIQVQAYLARRQDTVNLSDHGFIAAQIRRGIEYKADVEPKVVPFIIPQ